MPTINKIYTENLQQMRKTKLLVYSIYSSFPICHHLRYTQKKTFGGKVWLWKWRWGWRRKTGQTQFDWNFLNPYCRLLRIAAAIMARKTHMYAQRERSKQNADEISKVYLHNSKAIFELQITHYDMDHNIKYANVCFACETEFTSWRTMLLIQWHTYCYEIVKLLMT